MPIREHVCANDTCAEFGKVVEHYFPTSDIPDQPCGSCEIPMRLALSTFGIVFTGPITKRYLSKGAEGSEADDGSHYQWATKDRDGQPCAPRLVKIETFQQQRDFCREQRLINPSDIGPCEVHQDGKGVSTRGLPGCW